MTRRIGREDATVTRKSVPWSRFDLINGFNAWKHSQAAGRMFVAASDGTITEQVTGLTWRHAVSAQGFEEASRKLNVPLALLNQVPAARTEWLVPGLLKEKVKALAKSMPQRLRHKLGPLDEFATAFSDAVPPSDMPLGAALARFIREEMNLDVPLDALRPDSAPPPPATIASTRRRPSP